MGESGSFTPRWTPTVFAKHYAIGHSTVVH